MHIAKLAAASAPSLVLQMRPLKCKEGCHLAPQSCLWLVMGAVGVMLWGPASTSLYPEPPGLAGSHEGICRMENVSKVALGLCPHSEGWPEIQSSQAALISQPKPTIPAPSSLSGPPDNNSFQSRIPSEPNGDAGQGSLKQHLHACPLCFYE